MTIMRLAGLAWMGLVVVGLVLIALRIVLRRRNLWLLNGNVAAAFMTIWLSGFVDFAAIVANFNVERALAAADPMASLDINYLIVLGPSAYPAMKRFDAELLARARQTDPEVPAHTFNNQIYLAGQLARQQSDWRQFTIRHALIGDTP